MKTHGITIEEYSKRYPEAKLTTRVSMEIQKQSVFDHYGVYNPSQSSEIQKKKEDTCLSNFGVKHPMQSDEVWDKSRESTKRNLGVEYPTSSKEVKEKRKETWLKNLGVDNPRKDEAVKQKARETNLERYGVTAPFCQEWSLQKAQLSLGSRKSKQEQILDDLTIPELVYIGRRGLSFRLKDKSLKFPDFIYMTKDYEDTSIKIVEYFGEYWHDYKVTGLSREDHENQTIELYKEIGVACLVVWDTDLKDEDKLLSKIQNFLCSESSENTKS
jgi:G:T-mismatch repair DNA endonuclease (very short patch repair protein)